MCLLKNLTHEQLVLFMLWLWTYGPLSTIIQRSSPDRGGGDQEGTETKYVGSNESGSWLM